MLPNTPSWLQYRPLPLHFGLKQLQNSLVRIQIGPNAVELWACYQTHRRGYNIAHYRYNLA